MRIPRSLLLLLSGLAACVAVTPEPQAQPASFEGLGDLPGGTFSSRGEGLSANGLAVAGNSTSADSTGESRGEAYRWTAESGMVPIGDLPGGAFASAAEAASADGSVVVGNSRSGPSAPLEFEAFLWTAETGMVGLGDLPGGEYRSFAHDVSDGGSVVVGSSGVAGPNNLTAAFVWTEAAGMVQLPDLPGGSDERCSAQAVSGDGAVVVGQGSGSGLRQATRWVGGVPTGLGGPAGATSSYAHDTNGDGSVVVGYYRVPGQTAAFRWTEAVGMVTLPDPPGGSTYEEALAVSADGRVATGIVGMSAAIWAEGAGGTWTCRLVREALEAEGLDMTGWTLVAAKGVSADGTVIAGTGFNPSGASEGWRAVLPRFPVGSEPTTTSSVLTLSVAPNPARSASTVRLVLPVSGRVRVAAYDVLGRVAAVLHDGPLAAGVHAFSLDATRLAPGAYVVRVEGPGVHASRPLTVVR